VTVPQLHCQLGSPSPRENEFPHPECSNDPRIFRAFFFLLLQPVRSEEPLSQLTHRGRRTFILFSSLSAVGKVPGDSAESLDPRALPIFRSERPLQRKATASKHSRFTPVRFTLLVGRKCGSGEGDVFLALCLVFPSWLTGTDGLSRLHPLCDCPLVLCPSPAPRVWRLREDMSVLRT